MSEPLEIRIPKYPPCWDSCGSCRTESVFIQSVLVAPGERVQQGDTLVILETGKVALDIPVSHDGTILEVYVVENDPVDEGELIVLMQPDG